MPGDSVKDSDFKLGLNVRVRTGRKGPGRWRDVRETCAALDAGEEGGEQDGVEGVVG